MALREGLCGERGLRRRSPRLVVADLTRNGMGDAAGSHDMRGGSLDTRPRTGVLTLVQPPDQEDVERHWCILTVRRDPGTEILVHDSPTNARPISILPVVQIGLEEEATACFDAY